jgi:hypothetical protein
VPDFERRAHPVAARRHLHPRADRRRRVEAIEERLEAVGGGLAPVEVPHRAELKDVQGGADDLPPRARGVLHLAGVRGFRGRTPVGGAAAVAGQGITAGGDEGAAREVRGPHARAWWIDLAGHRLRCGGGARAAEAGTEHRKAEATAKKVRFIHLKPP